MAEWNVLVDVSLARRPDADMGPVKVEIYGPERPERGQCV